MEPPNGDIERDLSVKPLIQITKIFRVKRFKADKHAVASALSDRIQELFIFRKRYTRLGNPLDPKRSNRLTKLVKTPGLGTQVVIYHCKCGVARGAHFGDQLL